MNTPTSHTTTTANTTGGGQAGAQAGEGIKSMFYIYHLVRSFTNTH